VEFRIRYLAFFLLRLGKGVELYLLFSDLDTTFKRVIIEALSGCIEKEILVGLHLLSSFQVISYEQVLSLTDHLFL
jgi:hypothetical protein